MVSRRRGCAASRWPTQAGCGLLLLLVLGPGCRFFKLQLDHVRDNDHGTLFGEVRRPGGARAPLVVVAFGASGRCRARRLCLSASQYIGDAGSFEFYLKTGEYLLLSFEDSNGNGAPDLGEPSSGRYLRVELQPSSVQRQDLVVDQTLEAETNWDLVSADWFDRRLFVVGETASLDDRGFEQEIGIAAVWSPVRVLHKVPMGLFVLGEVVPTKMPVIYVHGMGGYPREFKTMISRLPESSYTPWVFQYPGGFRLRRSSDTLRKGLLELIQRFGPRRLAIVAHSMGGLVVRGALGELEAEGVEICLVTIGSPFGGVPSAAQGVSHLPISVPSWRDLGPESAFVRGLFRRPMNAVVDYLLVDLRKNEADDGVVSVVSQHRAEAIAEASRRHSYRIGHVAALHSEVVSEDVNGFLDHCQRATVTAGGAVKGRRLEYEPRAR